MARRRLTAAALAVVAIVAACTRGDGGDDAKDGRAGGPSTTTATDTTTAGGDQAAVEDPVPDDATRGGVVRVAVWASPDPKAPTLGGAAVRSLVLPQLFYAKPDGRWGPMVVEPGSDRGAADSTSATFRLRKGSAWSDGTPITVDDLRRSADARFVAAVEGPAGDGTITLKFTQPLPGWRRLWSGVDSISAPRDGVWGGPFAVSSVSPGLETVLERNPGWKGQGPFLDELRLVLVPDPATARHLLAKGDVDVVSPPAETRRTTRLQASAGVRVHSTIAEGGWWVGLHLNGARLGHDDRVAVAATVDRTRTVSVLLEGEAVRLDGFGGPTDDTWAGAGVGEAGALRGDTIDLVGEVEEPMTVLLHRAMQKRARAAGGRLELRAAESDRVEPWLAEGSYQAALVMSYDGPHVCWRCRWEIVDADLARRADAGDTAAVAALEAKLAGEALVVPLWRPRAVVAWSTAAVDTVRANPFGLSAAWDAWRWTAR